MRSRALPVTFVERSERALELAHQALVQADVEAGDPREPEGPPVERG